MSLIGLVAVSVGVLSLALLELTYRLADRADRWLGEGPEGDGPG